MNVPIPASDPVWLALCGPDDQPALWAVHRLNRAGAGPFQLVTAEALAYAVGWTYRGGNGPATGDVRLPDGRRLHMQRIAGVLNRLMLLPPDFGNGASAADRQYAQQELLALVTSWLAAIPAPVVSRPAPHALAGRWRHISEWLILAARAGLATVPWRESSGEAAPEGALLGRAVGASVPLRTVLVVCGAVCSEQPVPAAVRAGCERLATSAAAEILGVECTTDWRVAGVSPFPDLRLGGQPLIDRLRQVFAGGAAAGDDGRSAAATRPAPIPVSAGAS